MVIGIGMLAKAEKTDEGQQEIHRAKPDEVTNISHFEKVIRSWSVVRPIAACKPGQVADYWQALMTADTLKYRLCNTEHPGKEDVRKLLMEPFVQSYYVWDRFQKKITAEFMLENFTGSAAQVHFSMLPSNHTPYSIETATWVTNDVLNKWRKNDKDEPFLKTLYGLTPTTNRVARIFIRRVGFKTLGVIPDAMMDRGKTVDALLTIKTRKK